MCNAVSMSKQYLGNRLSQPTSAAFRVYAAHAYMAFRENTWHDRTRLENDHQLDTCGFYYMCQVDGHFENWGEKRRRAKQRKKERKEKKILKGNGNLQCTFHFLSKSSVFALLFSPQFSLSLSPSLSLFCCIRFIWVSCIKNNPSDT